jgi:hypothetical protein
MLNFFEKTLSDNRRLTATRLQDEMMLLQMTQKHETPEGHQNKVIYCITVSLELAREYWRNAK